MKTTPEKDGGVAALFDAAARAAQKEQETKVRETLVEITTKSYDRASTLTNLIVVAGYAGIFTIWGLHAGATIGAHYHHSCQPSRNIIVTFIALEVLKMVVTAHHFLKTRKIIITPMPPERFLEKIKDIKTSEAALMFWFMPIWAMVVTICVSSALGGLGLLFYNFLAILAAWPLWP